MRNGAYICEFSNRGGHDTILIWPNHWPDLRIDHPLNLPKYADDSFFLVNLDSFDGHSRKFMSKVAAGYGFYKIHFRKAYNEWKTKIITKSMPSPTVD